MLILGNTVNLRNMKRSILFAAALIAVFGCADSPEVKKDAPERYGWSGHDLYGNVKSVTVTKFYLTSEFGEEIIGDEMLKDVYCFDPSHGNVISHKSRSTVSYWDYTYTYDEKGNCIEQTTDVNGERRTKYNYVYDSMSNLIEYSVVDAQGVYRNKVIYTYDSAGNRIQENGVISWYKVADEKTINTFDSDGHCIETNEYDSYGNLTEKTTYAYDSNGNCIEENETRYWSDGSVGKEKITRVYDSDGNCIEENTYFAGEMYKKETYAYDTDGKLVKKGLYSEVGARITTFTYDSNGNCIEEKECVKSGEILYPDKLTKYEIEYFE